MTTKMRITWALVSLGLLYYCANADDPQPLGGNPAGSVDNETRSNISNADATNATAPTVLLADMNATLPANATTAESNGSHAEAATVTKLPEGGVPVTTTTSPQTSSGGAGLSDAGAGADPSNATTQTHQVTDPAAAAATNTAMPTPLLAAVNATLPTTVTTAASHGGQGGNTETATQLPGGGGGGVPITTTDHHHTPAPTNSGAGTQKPAMTQRAEEKQNTSQPDISGSVSTSQSTIGRATVSNPTDSIVNVIKSSPVPHTKATITAAATTTAIPTTTPEAPKIFTFSMSKGDKEDDPRADLTQLCKRLMKDMHNATCRVTGREHNGAREFDCIEMSGKVDTALAHQYYEEMNKPQRSDDNTTLIAILASCGALLAMIVGGAIYVSRHRKPYCENQQHLTEELQTVENGYHDNPTLEVMEVQPEMQEKKTALNGEFNDSWIVPIDNLLKEEIPDEEDTHL